MTTTITPRVSGTVTESSTARVTGTPTENTTLRVPAVYSANGVNFDGSTTYLTRDAGLTGVVDSKLLTVAGRLKSGEDITAANRSIIKSVTIVGGTSARFNVTVLTNHRLLIQGMNAAGSTILDIRSTTNSFEVADDWVHFMASVDMADTAKRHLYINGVSDLAVTAYTDDTIDFTLADWGIGGEPDASLLWKGDMADLLFWPGSYLDLSDADNRGLFITSAGKPVNPNVAIASLGKPPIGLYGITADWHTNKGNGGGFTENGALTDAATDPED